MTGGLPSHCCPTMGNRSMTVLAEQRKAQKHKARQMPGFVHLLSDRLYSRPTDFIFSDHHYQFGSRSGVDVILWMLKSAP